MSNHFDAVADRVTGLYSLPAVAMEVVDLTHDPEVDAATLTTCLEKDPALTAKVLRVVNSSLFGLSAAVSDLNQATAMLGTGPLKLLVLGFSLPPDLFVGATKEQLQWYWAGSLTRAVAARQLSQSLWHDSGNEAFLAALLQDIGLLALLQELGEAFAKFLGRVVETEQNLLAEERSTLGFDHRKLTVAMLKKWNLPPLLINAINNSEPPARLAKFATPTAQIAQVLHLADLLSQLVADRRLNALPEIMEVGELYRGLTKSQLREIVAQLQPQVEQLAEILQLDLPENRDYQQVLEEAQQETANLVNRLDELAIDDRLCQRLLHESGALREAIDNFLAKNGASAGQSRTTECDSENTPRQVRYDGSVETQAAEQQQRAATAVDQSVDWAELHELVTIAARGCRMRRSELSLLLLKVDEIQKLGMERGPEGPQQAIRLLRSSCQNTAPESAAVQQLAADLLAVVVTDCERRQAVALATEVFDCFTGRSQHDPNSLLENVTLSSGVASVSSIFKNFNAESLVQGAQRCLAAAEDAGGNSVKSIEVF